MPPGGDKMNSKYGGSIPGASSGSKSGAASTGNLKGPQDGFIMKGLPSDSHQAWTTAGSFHECNHTEAFITRIHKATEIQRPKRTIRKLQPGDPGYVTDQRKYVWPMMKSHLPETWDKVSARRRKLNHRTGVWEEIDESSSMLTIDANGKTAFPYSLVLHKAFLESQPDEALRKKAREIAPMRLSTGAVDHWSKKSKGA